MLNIDLSSLVANGSSPKYDGQYITGNRPITSWQLATGHFEGYMSPIIAYPRPDSETAVNARHRVNYPGQNYRVPVAVNGGAWPFYYELLSGPAGMTIGTQMTLSGGELIADADYGIINYANAAAGTYTVTVRVTDQNLIVNTITWQLVVSTTDWIFFDASAGTNGTGTLASPYNNLSSFSGLTTKKVLYRASTVDLEQKTIGLDSWPKTHLPYGNESVTMNKAMSSVGADTTGDIWFSGFTFKVPPSSITITEYNQFFRLAGTTRTVFFENTFDYENQDNPNTGGANSSVLMWSNASAAQSSTNNAWYCVVMRNTFKNLKDRDTWLGYSMRYAVIERNSMENCTTTFGGHGFYSKTSVDYLTFRGNYSIGTTNTLKLFRMDAYVGYFPMDYYDISYNNYRYYGSDSTGDGIGAISFGSEFWPAGTHHYVYRNTFYSQSAAGIHARGQASGSTITCSNNVLISGGTNTNGVQLVAYDGTLTNTGYVAGNTSAGIVDSTNNLLGSFRTAKLGIAGAEIA
jgi:hypothetical protein